MLALQVLLDAREEAPGLGSLDDAVVVGGGHRHDLLGADHRADRAEADGVGDRAGGDDRALAAHQPRDRRDGAEAAGVGEREVGADEVVGGERVGAGLLDQGVVGGEEAVERQARGVGDHGHHQRARSVALLHVDGEPKVDLPVADAVGPAVDGGEVVGHHRHVLRGARDGVGDQVGERHPLPSGLQLAPAGVQHGDGERAEAGGGGDRARLVHVAGQRGGPALHRLGDRTPPTRAVCGAVAGGGIENVGLDDASRGPAAGDGREIHTLDGGDARCYGRDRSDRGAVGSRGWSTVGLGALVCRRGWGLAIADGDARDDLPDGDGVALLREQLGDDAGGGRGELDVDLVGGDLDDRVIELDRVADLGVPFEDRPLCYRLARGGGHDVDHLLSRGARRHLISL